MHSYFVILSEVEDSYFKFVIPSGARMAGIVEGACIFSPQPSELHR